jgi:hypothetical protein
MTMRAVRMRVRAGRLEPLDEMSLPEGTEVTVDIEVPDSAPQPMLEALRASAGAWSDEAHPDLQTREDVVKFVRGLRVGFERAL